MDMSHYILILNAGSSSLKFTVYREQAQEWNTDCAGQIEGIGAAPRFLAKDAQGTVIDAKALQATIKDARSAIEVLIEWLRRRYGGSDVLAAGHRVVHGGAAYAQPILITPQVLHDLRALIPLAPLHQPHNLAVIEAVAGHLPDVPQVACFDTSFHRTHPTIAQLVPLPRAIRDQGVQRYGFHGLSYEYIASVLPGVAPAMANGRVIVAHLGNGASLCALQNLKSIDCSMGFTALEGLCMGTRPGSIDPGVILYLLQGLTMSPQQVETLLYKQSGLLGISGISNDMRDLLASSDAAAALAVDYFVYRAAKEIGALAAALGGLDGLVFTAGIGEHSIQIRKRICSALAWLGLELDEAANAQRQSRISTPASRIAAWVIPTNEELMIARHTRRVLGL